MAADRGRTRQDELRGRGGLRQAVAPPDRNHVMIETGTLHPVQGAVKKARLKDATGVRFRLT